MDKWSLLNRPYATGKIATICQKKNQVNLRTKQITKINKEKSDFLALKHLFKQFLIEYIVVKKNLISWTTQYIM